jgi:hypothetical protein
MPSFSFIILMAASQKSPISALQKWKTHFSWDTTKIGLRGVPLHPKGHACVRYGLISTNYAIIRAKSSSFDLKSHATSNVVKGLSSNFLLSRFEFFFLHLGDIKWHHVKILHFFNFFELVTPDFEKKIENRKDKKRDTNSPWVSGVRSHRQGGRWLPTSHLDTVRTICD